MAASHYLMMSSCKNILYFNFQELPLTKFIIIIIIIVSLVPFPHTTHRFKA